VAVSESLDVVVVGAGGAGAPLAARLSNDPGCRVLVLEAGPVPRTAAGFPPELLDAAGLRGADPGHPDTWAYPAELTPSRAYTLARGRILGGSTTINGAYFVRARRADHDDWVARGLAEWSFEECLPFWRALEADHEYGATPLHGATGPMPVARTVGIDGGVLGEPGADRDTAEGASVPDGSGAETPTITAAFAGACRELGFDVEADKNGDQASGWGPLPMNVRGGIRWNTGLAYLVPLLGLRPNLEVRGGAEVHRVVFEGTRAVGVEYADADGVRVVVRAAEVVLAAGAIASPTILMRSGVGPAAHLRRHGIDVVADSPVGAAFSDHPQIAVRWLPGAAGRASHTPGQPPPAVRGLPRAGTVPAAAAAQDPPRAGTVLESVLNVELADGGDVEVLPLMRPIEELLSGDASPDAAFSVLVALQNPESRGMLRLPDEGAGHPPHLDYRSLSTPADIERMRAAVRLAVTLLESAAFEAVSDGLADLDAATIDDDARLDAWIQVNLGTALHLCGSAPMGADGDARAVVDPHGRVRGVTGLRVADLSIIPTVPRRGPAATAVLVGERIAAFMRAGA